MNRPIWGAVLFGLVVFVAGCSDSGEKGATSDKTAADGSQATAASAADPSGGTALSHKIAKRPTMEGRWVLMFYQKMSGLEVPAALLEISKTNKESKLAVKAMSFGIALSSPTLKLAQATPTSLHLVLEMTVQSMMPGQAPVQQVKQADIVVALRDGFARGTAQFNPLDGFLVAMVPSQLEQIQELHPEPLPESMELNGAKENKEEFLEKAAALVTAHPDSPLTVEMYPVLFATAQERHLDKAAVQKLADEYMKIAQLWGPRAALKARIDIASSLVKMSYLPDVAIHECNLALGELTEETIPIWRPVLEQMKEQAKDNEALALAHSGTPEQRAKSIPLLRERNARIPYDPIVLMELARYDEEHGKTKDAMNDYAKLAVLPLFDEILHQVWQSEKAKNPSPRESAEKLWKSLHAGKTDGFDKFLDNTYAESMPKFTGKAVKPRPADPENRVVLCELFTGADCGPCVAADVAFSHLLKTYAPSEVVPLQYHEHIPHADPLANRETEARFRYYFPEHGGTPTFVIDGMPLQKGGLLHQAGEVYMAIRGAVERFLTRKTTVRIQLSVQPKGNAIALTADAEGSFSPTDAIRMRLVLAEERVAMRGSNGIREHEMVVRMMPGGPQGIEMKDGKFHYQETIDLKAVKEQLNDQLSADEERLKSKFATKPLELANLRLVAFVQNDQSREVYQAKLLPFPTTAAPTPPKAGASITPPQESTVARNGK